MRYPADLVEPPDILPKTAQLSDKVSRLVNEGFGAEVEEFDRAAKIFEARNCGVLVVVRLTRVLEVHANKFQTGDHRIAVGDVMLALPIGNGAFQWIVCVHAANLSAACGSVRSRSAARYSCR